MAVQFEKDGYKWHKMIKSAQIPEREMSFLLNCRIKNILISQAAVAWEIYFECPAEPDEKIKEIINELWKNLFGDTFRLFFYFEVKNTYQDLENLYRLGWPEVINRLAATIPSCRGWLNNASYLVQEDQLQITVEQEIGWSYLIAQGIKPELERIIQEEYGINSCINIILKEENLEDNCVDSSSLYFDEIEDNYREVFNGTIEKILQDKQKTKQNTSQVVMGKKIKDKHTQLSAITEEEQNVTVRGYIFGLEKKELRSGRTLINFCISDKTDSISCKIITSADKAQVLNEALQEKRWYLFRGPVQTDRYTQELTLMPYDIMETEIEEREDCHEEKRVELHLHTKMSALDAVAEVKEVIKRAKKWGHKAVAITDHGVVQAFPEAHEAAKKQNIKVIYGVEGYLFDSSLSSGAKIPTYHCIILAVNQEGLRNLYELISISHLKHYYRTPRVPKSELIRLRKGLLVGSACEAGELIRAYLQGVDSQRLEEVAAFYDYLEIQPRENNFFLIENSTMKSADDILIMNKTIYELGKKLNKPVVATGDVHFIDPQDEVYRRILMAGKGFEDADNQAPLYFKTTDEMLEEFAYLGSEEAYEVVIKNPGEIADLIEEVIPIPDEFFPPVIQGAEDEIVNLTMTGAYELYGNPLPEIVKQRIERELNAIIKNGFAVLYLIAHKLVKKSNKDGYLVGSRGSVGSSLVATLCGITEVNPLAPHYRCPQCKKNLFVDDGSVGAGADLPDKKCPSCGNLFIKDGHNIHFEVFMGFEGDKVPDIDLNFSGDYQPRAHKYTEELFGRDNVFRAGTIATIANKTAYGFVKNYFLEKKQVLRSAETNRLVNGCTGVKRTTGQHPGGIMVLPKGLDVHRFTPLQRPADDIKSDTITSHFDYHAISSRLVKLDILGHDDPTVIKMLEDLTEVDCKTIPLDEASVLSLYCGTEALGVTAADIGTNVGTLGIPEFGTKFVRQMLEDTKPQTFSELVRICGFSHGTDVWLNNAQSLIKAGTAKVSEAISARDDILNFLILKGLNPAKAFKIMEDVRKGKGVRPDEVATMRENSIPEWYIESCQKISYLFPKAHAVAYVMMAFRIAYYKIYYPAAFYASFFTVRADEFDADIVIGGIPAIKQRMEDIARQGKEASQKEEKLYTILELALEMFYRGIQLKKVDLFHSDSKRFIIVDNNEALLPPLVSLQGLGEAAAQSIVKAREKKPFISREDLRIRAKLSKNVIDVLDNHGCLKGMPENDQITLF